MVKRVTKHLLMYVKQNQIKHTSWSLLWSSRHVRRGGPVVVVLVVSYWSIGPSSSPLSSIVVVVHASLPWLRVHCCPWWWPSHRGGALLSMVVTLASWCCIVVRGGDPRIVVLRCCLWW